MLQPEEIKWLLSTFLGTSLFQSFDIDTKDSVISRIGKYSYPIG